MAQRKRGGKYMRLKIWFRVPMLVTGNGRKRHFRLVEAPYGHPVGRIGSRYSDTSDYCGDRYIETFLFRLFPVCIFLSVSSMSFWPNLLVQCDGIFAFLTPTWVSSIRVNFFPDDSLNAHILYLFELCQRLPPPKFVKYWPCQILRRQTSAKCHLIQLIS